MELISARVPLQTPVTECYKYFSRPIDLRNLPGTTVDCFAYVCASTQYGAFAESFISARLSRGSHHYLPQGGGITVGRQDHASNLKWGSQRLFDLAMVGCDTMGIGSGGGFVTLTASDFHPIISHMMYFNIGFSEGELFGQKCLKIDLGGPVYTPTSNLYKVYILNTRLREYAIGNLKRM